MPFIELSAVETAVACGTAATTQALFLYSSGWIMNWSYVVGPQSAGYNGACCAVVF